MTDFIHGALTVCFVLAGLFFLRFYRDTFDRLFLLFALSFWLQAAVRLGLWLVGEHEERAYLYLFRFAAFALILVAIVSKNVSRETRMKG